MINILFIWGWRFLFGEMRFIVSLCWDSQGDRLRMCVTLLECFSILSFEINKIKFINSYETRIGLELLNC